jgi:hypothetical protein
MSFLKIKIKYTTTLESFLQNYKIKNGFSFSYKKTFELFYWKCMHLRNLI